MTDIQAASATPEQSEEAVRLLASIDALEDPATILLVRHRAAAKCAELFATKPETRPEPATEKGTMDEKSHMRAIRGLSTAQLLAAIKMPSFFEGNPESEERFLRVLLERVAEAKESPAATTQQA